MTFFLSNARVWLGLGGGLLFASGCTCVDVRVLDADGGADATGGGGASAAGGASQGGGPVALPTARLFVGTAYGAGDQPALLGFDDPDARGLGREPDLTLALPGCLPQECAQVGQTLIVSCWDPDGHTSLRLYDEPLTMAAAATPRATFALPASWIPAFGSLVPIAGLDALLVSGFGSESFVLRGVSVASDATPLAPTGLQHAAYDAATDRLYGAEGGALVVVTGASQPEAWVTQATYGLGETTHVGFFDGWLVAAGTFELSPIAQALAWSDPAALTNAKPPTSILRWDDGSPVGQGTPRATWMSARSDGVVMAAGEFFFYWDAPATKSGGQPSVQLHLIQLRGVQLSHGGTLYVLDDGVSLSRYAGIPAAPALMEQVAQDAYSICLFEP